MTQPSLALDLATDILNSLENSTNISLSGVLRKAIRLAELCDEPEYRILFHIHLDGTREKNLVTPASQLIAGLTDQADLEKVFKLFAEDRALGNDKIAGHPLEHLEYFLGAFGDLSKISKIPGKWAMASFESKSEVLSILNRIQGRVMNFTIVIQKRLSPTYNPQIPDKSVESMERNMPNGKVFIGHGHSNIWMELRELIQDRLGLDWDEFNRESTPGLSTKERLEMMLETAVFAFIIMTAEDEHSDGKLHARDNVIHEAGLFQGKLGFRRAILLVEEECEEFSNIEGLTQIRFPKGNIVAKSEEIRRVLEREGLLKV